MSKNDTIDELRLEVDGLNRGYAEAIRQRDKAERELDRIDGNKRLQDRAKREAEVQERVDGIKSGLIPVEELRKHIRQTFETTISQDRASYEFKLFFKLDDTDRIALAIRDAILKEHAPKVSGGYVNRDVLGKINTAAADSFFKSVINYYPDFSYPVL